MIGLIEYLLNGLVYALHGYAWAIQNNPLTDAWRNIDKSDWGKFKAPSGLSDQFQKDVKDFQKAQQRMNNPVIGNRHAATMMDFYRKAAKEKCEHEQRLKPTGFKEHVRREAQILEQLKPIRIIYSPYQAVNMSDYRLKGVVYGRQSQKANNSWQRLTDGLWSAIL